MSTTDEQSTSQESSSPRRPNGTGSMRRRGKIWWIRWYDANGRRHEESSESTKEKVAERLLRLRQGDVARGVPITAQVGRLRFGEAAKDLVTEYKINGRRSLDELERRIKLHLEPFFGGRRMAGITTADVRAYVAKRQVDAIVVQKARRVKKRAGWLDLPEVRRPVSAAEINRELTALKRMFSLAMQAGKLLYRPHIPMLKEHNVRTGFFEREQFDAVMRHLPEPIRPVVLFAYYTGWRIASEVLPLQWRQVDRQGGEVRLDAGTTKNDEGRTFAYAEIRELRELIEARWAANRALAAKGKISPYVFHREVKKRGSDTTEIRPIKAFTKAWSGACRAAGCPGRIPHDLRRTAVRNLIRAGVPDSVAMKITGHKTRSVFERYNVTSKADLTEAARRLNAASLNAPAPAEVGS